MSNEELTMQTLQVPPHIIVSRILQNNNNAYLATHSVDCEGYPFASFVPYVLDDTNAIIILISALAEHTKNIEQNSKISLLIIDEHSEQFSQDKPQAARISLFCLAEKVAKEKQLLVADQYVSVFPDSKMFYEKLDFSFFRLLPQRVRLIEGFGRVTWVDYPFKND